MSQQWRTPVVQRLLSAVGAAGCWGYSANNSGSTVSGGSAEPTALACLALASDQSAADLVSQGLQWLADLQRPDGGVPLSNEWPAPLWATSLTLLAWLKCGAEHAERHSQAIEKATAWLLQSAGQPLERTPIFGHDTTLIGWNWTDDTHSWVEPTAYAVLALRAAGMTEHERVCQGIHLLWDRLLPAGGWNYGNTRVFEKMLRPFPATTGVALTALAGETSEHPVQDTLDYLSTELQRVRAPVSLGWGLIGLQAWNARPDQAESWLQDSAALLGRRAVNPQQNALLLLAGAQPCPWFSSHRSMFMDQSDRPTKAPGISRRDLLKVGGAFAAGSTLGLAGLMWLRRREGGLRAPVFIARADSYQHDLTTKILDGLRALKLTSSQVRGKRVLLKPNLVETAPGKSHINTHPAMVIAAAEAFRKLDAAEVCVAEGQGHRRDSWLVLDESGMGQAIDDAKLPFVDLNHDDIVSVPNAAHWTKLTRLHLPRQIHSVDLVVSMPKLKTHHWAGVTCAMKNMFGVMPGVVYGWPKNVLHRVGIQRSILDINAAVRPGLAIVDGVIGMEGDGPIMGDPKHLGAVVVGQNLPAVDATCVRLMKLNPFGMPYLRVASGKYGPIRAANIEQRGESIESLCTRFQIIDADHLREVGNVT